MKGNLKLSDFLLNEEIGKGSFGRVYRSTCTKNSNTYVIKKINLTSLSFKHQMEAYNEVEVLKSISHPNIIKYFASFLENQVLSIVMEYAEGGDLYQMIRKRRHNQEVFTEQEI